MPHLRLEVPEEWLEEDFIETSGFDARRLLDDLVDVVAGLGMEETESGEMIQMINKRNLKHAIIPVHHSGVGGNRNRGFLHLTFSAGNDKPGRTAAVRRRAAQILGNAIDEFAGNLPDLASVTVHVKDIDRDRGYSTTAERKKKREQDS